MADDEAATVEARFRSYYSGTGDAYHASNPAMMRQWVAVPSLVLSATGVRLDKTPEELDARWRQLFSGFPANYDRSEVDTVDVAILNPGTAVVTASGRRYSAGGEVLAQLRGTYVMTKASGEWQVVVSIGHTT
jgi:hypothetical protein